MLTPNEMAVCMGVEIPYPEILNIFDAFIVQVESASHYRRISSIPPWFPPSLSSTDPMEFVQRSFFLQCFLHEAEEFWQTHEQGVLSSGFWSEPDLMGDESYFEATALVQEEQRFLIVRRCEPEMVTLQPVLQKAREDHLVHGKERDIHQHQLAESEQIRDDVTAVLDHLHLAVVMINESGAMTYANPTVCRLFGLTPQMLVGGLWTAILPWKGEQSRQVEEQRALPEGRRAPVAISLKKNHKPWLDLEVEVHDDPRDSRRTILFLKDQTEVEDLRRQLIGQAHFEKLIGKSPVMQAIYQKIQDIAPVDVPVLIQGETGTGKELVAKAVHRLSARKDRPFVAINCAGLTDSLLGSQLFGHKRGAFTGAVSDHEGFFEAAEGGILFLDEIGDMPVTIQTTLLRVLQEGEIIRLGESRPRKVDVRVLAATHQHIEELVEKGTFRSDLLYRIRVARLQLPPLRERREDIPLLSDAFLGQARAVTRKHDVQEIAQEAMQALLRYQWPGNVRELKSTLDYAMIHCHGAAIRYSDLPPELTGAQEFVVSTRSSPRDERAEILAALEQARGKRAQAAKLLGMSRSTFYRRLNELGIECE
ncbi:MAG: sigma 54-interacting transcriptional regulator [Nitrospirota bacterium]|nr:sigma 54-interacting transcriptional regulator [Nitrospirota bacterium]MDH5585560.1 sigma 54-interacting transcriptional regulator [Nitrospirota bacterium]MDH5773959.1 sigma 54-interacting transcriptional regulator [Nitrospirota bacterium]